MSFLTIFSAPKPFTNPHIATIQRNAIQSWLHLGEEADVLLVGEEAGLMEVATEYGVQVLSQVQRNASGTPLVSSIFALARQASDSPYFTYVNADILLMSDLLQAVRQVSSTLKSTAHTEQFLLIGQRWDLEIQNLLDFSPDWETRLQADIYKRGKLHPPAGSDYFVFPRTAFTEMPDFAIGRAGWDNWMIYHTHQQGWPVIDASVSITIVHQNHDYSHLPGGQPHYNLEESQANMSMAGGLAHMYMLLDADKALINGRIHTAPRTPQRTVRAMERWLMPKDGNLRSLRGALTRRLRHMRRGMA